MNTVTVQVTPKTSTTGKGRMIIAGIALVITGAVLIWMGAKPDPVLPCVHVTSYTDYNGPNPICQ